MHLNVNINVSIISNQFKYLFYNYFSGHDSYGLLASIYRDCPSGFRAKRRRSIILYSVTGAAEVTMGLQIDS